jgi:hypothetical protein
MHAPNRGNVSGWRADAAGRRPDDAPSRGIDAGRRAIDDGPGATLLVAGRDGGWAQREGLHRVRLAAPAFRTAATKAVRRGTPYDEIRARERPAPGWRSRGFDLQRHQPIAVVVLQAAEHGGHAAQRGLRAGAAGFAQGDELGRDFDQQDI